MSLELALAGWLNGSLHIAPTSHYYAAEVPSKKDSARMLSQQQCFHSIIFHAIIALIQFLLPILNDLSKIALSLLQ